MKSGAHVHVLYNPNAGDQNDIKKELIRLIKSEGFSYTYASVKDKGWQHFKKKTVMLVVAGGDGTVRQVTKEILNRKLLDKHVPLVVLPVGTANNFAKTLQLSPRLPDLLHRIRFGQLKKIDVGVISNLPKPAFFLEGMGFGLFPKLIKVMQEPDRSSAKTNEQQLDEAFEKLIGITARQKAKHSSLIIDGKVYEGNFLLIEILNTKSIGPNLELAPAADPADGKFHVALLREEMRQEFITYLKRPKKPPTKKEASSTPWELIEVAAGLTILSENRLLHIDDELVDVDKKKRIVVEIRKGVLEVVL